MQYFPHEGTIDRMYFPYYGKKSHVSSPHVLANIMIKDMQPIYFKPVYFTCINSLVGGLRSASGGCKAVA